jgi:hypothetical protein
MRAISPSGFGSVLKSAPEHIEATAMHVNEKLRRSPHRGSTDDLYYSTSKLLSIQAVFS